MQKLPDSAHTSRPWRIHELTRDFRLEDVWEIRAPGRPDDWETAAEMLVSLDPSESSSLVVRALFALRWKIGGLLGWDKPDSGLGSRVPTLRDRLPADLRDTAPPRLRELPFTSLYITDDEFAAEIANGTMHGVLHTALVDDGAGGHHAQMAVLVKPNGLFGVAYMAAIKPFRYLAVYPAMLGEFERAWQARADQRAAASR
ncbi:MAG TPA: DUF2867 domain-containing protein [Solirubrobacteraceae bacterium]|nr:DUF2867 domain-containing protein [Solirubrobacteraceae bacterium]